MKMNNKSETSFQTVRRVVAGIGTLFIPIIRRVFRLFCLLISHHCGVLFEGENVGKDTFFVPGSLSRYLYLQTENLSRYYFHASNNGIVELMPYTGIKTTRLSSFIQSKWMSKVCKEEFEQPEIPNFVSGANCLINFKGN